MMDSAEVSSLLSTSNLDTQEKIQDLLSHLNTYAEALLHLQSTAEKDIKFKELITSVPLNFLFGYLNSAENEEYTMEVAASVISKILQGYAVDLETALSLKQYILQGINHPLDIVRILSVRQALSFATRFGSFVDEDFLVSILKLLSDDSTTVATEVTKIFVTCLSQNSQLSAILNSSHFQNVLKELFRKNSVVKLRCYDALISLLSESTHDSPQLANSVTILLDSLKSDLETSSDILLQVSVVEMCTLLSKSAKGWEIAQSLAIPNTIVKFLDPSNSLNSFLIPTSLKFIGSLSQSQFVDFLSFFNSHSSILTALIEFIEGSDLVNKQAAIDTLGLIGSSSNGFRVILQMDSSPPLKRVLKESFVYFASANPDLENCVMNAFASIIIGGESLAKNLNAFNDDKNEFTSSQIEANLSRLFQLLPGKPSAMSLVFDRCRQPFPDVKFSAFHLCYALAAHLWGQTEMANLPGFMEFLLNRSSESQKEGIEWKYKIIERLHSSILKNVGSSSSSSSLSLFNPSTLARIKSYVQEGPFGSTQTLSIATNNL